MNKAKTDGAWRDETPAPFLINVMEFHEKLQNLRKKYGMTQQELADKLYVSRTAVSKWESGKGYPNIDSLKSIAALFSVSVDELLSGGEILEFAESDGKSRVEKTCGLIFGLLDVIATGLAFLPLYGKTDGGIVRAVTLLGNPDASRGIVTAFFAMLSILTATGVAEIAVRYTASGKPVLFVNAVSVAIHMAAILLFALARQPYATAILFVLYALKIVLIIKMFGTN